MLFKILNPIFIVGFLVVLLMLVWSSTQVIMNNIRYVNVIKTGKIVAIEYVKGDEGGGTGTYDNKVLLDSENEIVLGGTQEAYAIGDSVKLRYTGKVPSTIFEVNGAVIGWKYGIWDWLSPFLLVFCTFMLFKYMQLGFSKLKKLRN